MVLELQKKHAPRIIHLVDNQHTGQALRYKNNDALKKTAPRADIAAAAEPAVLCWLHSKKKLSFRFTQHHTVTRWRYFFLLPLVRCLSLRH